MPRNRFHFEYATEPASFRERGLAAAQFGLEAAPAANAEAPARTLVMSPPLPRMPPREEAITLLLAAAEIEHSLMVMYLYAAFSLELGLPAPQNSWGNRIRTVAIEEMAHLASVQNILLVLGGPIHFERQDFPYQSELYPLPFHLEPLTLRSLAKYIAAERPETIPDPATDTLYETEIKPLTQSEPGDPPVNRVGALFNRLLLLFRDPASVSADDPSQPVADEDFQLDVGPQLATQDEWGQGDTILGPKPDQLQSAQSARAAIRETLAMIADQGEGSSSSPPGTSHFDRFIAIWREYRANYPNSHSNDVGAHSPTRPIPSDPTVHGISGRQVITQPQSRKWGMLCNLSYRSLLGYLQHYFESVPPVLGRDLLSGYAIDAMTQLGDTARRLVQRPLADDNLPDRAGPPFELPSTLALPIRERDRWRMHRDVVAAALELARDLRADSATSDIEANKLDRLIKADEARFQQLTSLMRGEQPDGPVVTVNDPNADFLALLREKQPAAMTRHGGIDTPDGTLKSLFQASNFDAIVRFLRTGQSVLLNPPGMPLVVPGKPEESAFFLQARDGVMKTRFTDAEREVIRAWIAALPPNVISNGTAPSFATDIRPLFREFDINAMRFVLDLSKYEDVRDHADTIFGRVSDGSMPCDGPWPADRVALFKKWIDTGKNP